MRILGIDPGYAIIGWGVLDYKGNKFSVVDYGAITTQAKTPFPLRLQMIYTDMIGLFDTYHPEVMSMEKLFYNNNAKTVIDVAQARGVITLSAQQKNVPIFEYTPLQVKQSVVGYGRAEKKQVQEMTRLILNLEKIPKPDDTADALAMAISLDGTLTYFDQNFAVVSCGGVGFKCFTTLTTLQSLPGVGKPVQLFTYLSVREDALDLYGFATTAELDCFKLLISVNGVGPKAALAILSELSADRLAVCIAGGDAKSLTRAPGIGKKIAERIVLELKDKMGVLDLGSSSEVQAAAAANTAGSVAAEAVEALVALGYGQSDAAVAVGQMEPGLSVDEMIRRALRQLAANL